MEAASQAVIDNLQTSCQMLAHLAEQYRVDKYQLKAMGLKWLAKRVKCWYAGSEKYLAQLIERLLYFDEDPEYDAGPVSGSDDIVELLTRASGLVYAAIEKLGEFRKAAWDAEADYTPDIYEHAICEFERQAKHIDRELALIAKLGEPGYIACRLGDGGDGD
jgi:bacterioferritin (cytochrome b1)